MSNADDLLVFAKAKDLAVEIYRATRLLPPDEKHVLSPQMRRAAASIPANLAEGCGRASDRELARYTAIAQGSAAELHVHLTLCREAGLLPERLADGLIRRVEEVRRMLHGLRRTLDTATRRSRSDRGR